MNPPESNKNEPPRRRLLLVGLGVVAAVVLAGAVLFNSGGDSATSTGAASDLPPAPDVSYTTFHGETIALSELQGKPLVLNFFASWCPACIAEMPDFEAVHAKFGDEQVTFLGLATSDEADPAYALRDVTGITYETGLDADGTIYQAFGGFAMPTTIFIDASGRIVEKHSGVLFASDLEEKVNELLLGN